MTNSELIENFRKIIMILKAREESTIPDNLEYLVFIAEERLNPK